MESVFNSNCTFSDLLLSSGFHIDLLVCLLPVTLILSVTLFDKIYILLRATYHRLQDTVA